METHAHHLHNAPGKNLWHYFFEFFMLFLAVTLGFFMENLREEHVLRKREKEYMKSMIEDLKKDTFMLGQSIEFSEYLRDGLDTLRNELFNEDYRNTKQAEIYRLNYTYGRLIAVEYNDQTTTQLRNAGGMQTIKNPEIANAIASYWNEMKTLEMISETYKTSYYQNVEESFHIFNRKFILSIKLDAATGHSIVKIDPAAKLMTTDENTLIAYGNRISSLIARLSTFFPVNLKAQYADATALMALIKKNYNLE